MPRAKKPKRRLAGPGLGPRLSAGQLSRLNELFNKVSIAAEQIDSEPGGRLGWVLRFVREDPKRWLPGEREAHGYRLLALGLRATPGGAPLVPGSRPLTASDVAALHTELRDWFHRLVNTPAMGLVEIPSDGLKTSILRAPKPGERGANVMIRRGPFRVTLWQTVADLACDTTRLVACPTCDQPFLALRKMKFCSPECTQRFWNREKVKAKQRGVGR